MTSVWLLAILVCGRAGFCTWMFVPGVEYVDAASCERESERYAGNHVFDVLCIEVKR